MTVSLPNATPADLPALRQQRDQLRAKLSKVNQLREFGRYAGLQSYVSKLDARIRELERVGS